jgi:signal peptidase
VQSEAVIHPGVLATLLLASLLAAFVSAAMLWQDGYRIYAVRTGSMAPTYPSGTLVVDAPAKTHDPAVGQVITFQTPGGLVTHRVRGFARGGFTTQGDANRTPDPWTVRRVHVIGLVSLGIAGGGYVLVFLQQPTAVLSLVLLAISVTFAWSLFFSTPKPGGLDPGARGDGFLAMRAV